MDLLDRLNRYPTAALFEQPFATVEVDSHWYISDLDAFYSNLDLWCEEEVAFIDALFSKPISGVKQHLADWEHHNVGLAGVALKDETIRTPTKEAYLQRGYVVVHLRPDQVSSLSQPSMTDNVRISWR